MTADTKDQGLTEATERAEQQADDLQEGIDRVGEHIDESKATLKAVQEDGSIPTAAADVDDDDEDDDDSDGFDDPEADEDEDEDDE